MCGISDAIRLALVGAERSQRGRLVAAQLQGPLLQAHGELVRVDRHAGISVEAGRLGSGGQADLEPVHDRTEEKEKLHAGQDVAEAHSTADAERHKIFGFLNLAGFGVDETTRPKLLRIFPQRRVHVNGANQGQHMTASWYFVTGELLIAVKRNDSSD